MSVNCSQIVSDIDQSLQIATVFIVICSSSLGLSVSLIGKLFPRLQVPRYTILVGKNIGTGVVLACALVHLLQPAAQSFSSACLPEGWQFYGSNFPFLYSVIAICAMHCFEFVLQVYYTDNASKDENGIHKEIESDVEKNNNGESFVLKNEIHSHDHLHNINVDESRIQAYMLEFGLTVHSVIIGLALGVVSGDQLQVLCVALAFHQLFEGIALGSRLADSVTLSPCERFTLACIFSLSCPLGLTIGAIITGSVNYNGAVFLLTQGTFDGFCSGLLLYVGFNLLLADFYRDIKPYTGWRRVGLFIAMWFGAGMMCYIGVYL